MSKLVLFTVVNAVSWSSMHESCSLPSDCLGIFFSLREGSGACGRYVTALNDWWDIVLQRAMWIELWIFFGKSHSIILKSLIFIESSWFGIGVTVQFIIKMKKKLLCVCTLKDLPFLILYDGFIHEIGKIKSVALFSYEDHHLHVKIRAMWIHLEFARILYLWLQQEEIECDFLTRKNMVVEGKQFTLNSQKVSCFHSPYFSLYASLARK